MIIFVDESYQQDTSGTWHYALAGFGINEFRYRALQAAVYQLIRQYYDTKSSYLGDDWKNALTSKMITETPVEEIELKATSLLKRSSLDRFGGEQSPHYRLVRDVLAKVRECRGTCLGVLVNPVSPSIVKDSSNGCPSTYVKLIKNVGRWMEEEYPGQPATLVLDTEHNGVNLPLSRSIADLLYRSQYGIKMKHIFPSPFWIDSQSMAGAQIADLVAHILMNSMQPEPERKPINRLWEQVNDLRWRWEDGRGGTITRLRKAMTDGGGDPADAG